MDKTHAASGTHPTFTRHRLPSPADQKPKRGITPAKKHIQPMQFVSTLAASPLPTSIPSPNCAQMTHPGQTKLVAWPLLGPLALLKGQSIGASWREPQHINTGPRRRASTPASVSPDLPKSSHSVSCGGGEPPRRCSDPSSATYKL